MEIKQSSLALAGEAPFQFGRVREGSKFARGEGEGRRRFTVLSIIIDMTTGEGGATKS